MSDPLDPCPFCGKTVYRSSAFGFKSVKHADDSQCILRKQEFLEELWQSRPTPQAATPDPRPDSVRKAALEIICCPAFLEPGTNPPILNVSVGKATMDNLRAALAGAEAPAPSNPFLGMPTINSLFPSAGWLDSIAELADPPAPSVREASGAKILLESQVLEDLGLEGLGYRIVSDPRPTQAAIRALERIVEYTAGCAGLAGIGGLIQGGEVHRLACLGLEAGAEAPAPSVREAREALDEAGRQLGGAMDYIRDGESESAISRIENAREKMDEVEAFLRAVDPSLSVREAAQEVVDLWELEPNGWPDWLCALYDSIKILRSTLAAQPGKEDKEGEDGK